MRAIANPKDDSFHSIDFCLGRKPDWKQIAIAWLSILCVLVSRFPVGLVAFNERIESTKSHEDSLFSLFINYKNQQQKEHFRGFEIFFLFLYLIAREGTNMSTWKADWQRNVNYCWFFSSSSDIWSIGLVHVCSSINYSLLGIGSMWPRFGELINKPWMNVFLWRVSFWQEQKKNVKNHSSRERATYHRRNRNVTVHYGISNRIITSSLTFEIFRSLITTNLWSKSVW